MRQTVVGLLLAAAFAAQPAQAEVLEKSIVAGWDLLAYSDDQGRFTACEVGAPYQNGISLGFMVFPDFQWEMNLYNESWSLRKNDRFTIGLSIDGGPEITRSATAFDTDFVSIPLSAQDDTFASLKHGRLLRIRAAGGQFFFRLDGTARSLQAVVECTDRWNAIAQGRSSKDPFSGRSASADPFSGADASSAGPRPAAYAAEAMPVLTGMLNAAGITGYTLLPFDKAKDLMPDYDAVWASADLFGGLLIVPEASPANVGDAMSGIAGNDAKACKGKFGSYMPTDHTSPPVLRRLVVACDAPGESWEIHYTLLNRSKGGMYLFAAVGSPQADGSNPVQDADASFVDAVTSR